LILKLKDILPNPNRNLKDNPLDPAKITELVASIHTTGFWDNVVVRKNKAGKYELAYGHNRLAAAIKAGLTEADFIVKDFDDELMIKVMDNENREAYGTSPLSLIESVRAVVKGLAEGRVKPFEIAPNTPKESLRCAPSFVPGTELDRSSVQYYYTALEVAKFLGRTLTKGVSERRIKPEDSIIAALNALHLMELGKLNNDELFKEKLVRAPEGKKATEVKVPLTTNELLTLTSERKRDVEAVQERRGKTQQELNELREKQLAAQAKAKADEKAAEEKHKDLLKKEADARREENNRKADELAAQRKEADERAKAKEELNKKRMAELDEKIAQKKAWEAEQRIVDAYAPIRRDVESFISKYEMKASERNPEREEIKSLVRRKGLRTEDRARMQRVLRDYANFLYDWALPLFKENR